MKQSKKEIYLKICHDYEVPLFSQYYWMDAVCGKDNWDVIIAEKNGNILGTLVYYLNEINGEFEIRKAPLTQNNGIIYYYPLDIKYERKIAFENRVANLIIDEIEKLDIIKYRQYFHHNFTNWLPFYWRGYSQTTRYTYIIKDTSNMDLLYKNLSGNVRKHLKKANELVTVKNKMNPKKFYELNIKTFSRQNIQIPYDFETFDKLYNNLEKNNSMEIFYAIDKEENIHSAALFAFDKNSVYYLMSGSNEKFRSSQSLTLLIYEGIKLASSLGKSFDFEGSMKINIEKFFRQFGAKQKLYFDIQKDLNL